MKTAKTYTADEMLDLLRSKYSGGAYSVLEQVANGTGAGTGSWIDAAVFSLWPSNGIWRGAYEVKVSRGDFLRELSKPSKNEWAREHFDYFWYVVAPGVAKDDEVPMGCGLMAVRGSGLAVVKQAPRRENVKTDSSLIASFARSLDKHRERFIRDELQKAIEDDYRYREAILWQAGADKYLRHLNGYCHPKTADDVFNALIEHSRKTTREAVEADHMLRVLEGFSDHVLKFLLAVAPLAADVINARDETAQFIVEKYGGNDGKAVEALKAALKGNRKRGHWMRREIESVLETRQAIAEMGRPSR